ncbi:MAG: hypothetical protein ACJA1W_004710 [Akkermansiaceae bacterium]|jgi:hypothetical protein
MTFFLGLYGRLQAGDELSWHGNYKDALAESKENGHPILLTFR